MAVRIRLTRVGATKRPSYRVVAIDSRRPRDGRSLEILGFYDPLTDPATVKLDAERVDAWIAKGAKPSDSVGRLMRQAGMASAPPAPVSVPTKAEPKPPRKAKPTKASTKAKAEAPAAAAEPADKADEPAAEAAPAADEAAAPEMAAAAETAEPAEPAEVTAAAEEAEPAEEVPPAEAAEAPETSDETEAAKE